LYEKKGYKMVHDLNGMYSFVLYDKNLSKLFIVRDRMGVKPLYYYFNSGVFYFSSELKSIISIPGVSKEIDYDSLSTYLDIMYIPSPHTPFSKIKKLNSGSFLEFNDGKITQKEYWSPCLPENYNNNSISVWSDELFELIQDSIKLQLRSDVPLGSFLSGGIDSSSITSLAAMNSSKRISTFNVYWKDVKTKIDERPFAELIVNNFNTNHHVLGIDGDNVPNLLPKLIWHLEEPFADAAFIPTYLISKWASQKVKVLLNGAGGDELFGGYQRYLQSNIMRVLKTLYESILYKKDLRWSYYNNNMCGKNRNWKKIFNFYNTSPRKNEIEIYFEQNSDRSFLNAMMLNDIKVYLQDDILFLLDKMTMAVSIEGRVPLLDHRLVEKSLNIPSSLKINNGQGKYLYKKMFENILPKEILYRKKEGFGAPIWDWIDKYKQTHFDEILKNSYLEKEGLINKNSLETKYIKKDNFYLHEYWNYWKILILEIWFQVFIINDIEH